ncbi:hypothetical protein D3C80_983440 [compost metagenome]
MPNIQKPAGLNTIWANGGTRVDPGLAKTNIGWVVQLPPYEQANWIEWRQDTFNAHVNQHGIPEWDNATEYQGLLSYTQGSDGIIYKCILTHTNKDPINPLNSTYWSRAFETYGSVQVVETALNQHITNYQSLSGISNPTAARNNLSVWSKAEGDNRYAYKAGTVGQPFSVGTATLASHAVPLSQIGSLLVAASESVAGITQYATSAETQAGAINNKAVTPAALGAGYLKRVNNLSDVASPAQARTNLGITSTATLPSDTWLNRSNNLADLTSVPTARANLGLTSTALQPETYFIRTGLNLSDVPDKAAARANLGLTGLAITDPNAVMFKGDNLAGITSPALARQNLGLSDSGLYPSNTWLNRSNNLADLTNVQGARNNLGLGPLATMGLWINQSVGALDFTNSLQQNGYQKLPGGLIIQWGVQSVPADGLALVTFPIAFPSAGFVGFSGHIGTTYNLTTDAMASFTFVNTQQAYLGNGYGYSSAGMYWFCIGA